MRDFIEQHIERYAAKRDKALETIQKIESGHWRFEQSFGGEPMRDCTAERLVEQRDVVDMMNGLIEAYRRELDRLP